jgi:hypothetical protein
MVTEEIFSEYLCLTHLQAILRHHFEYWLKIISFAN